MFANTEELVRAYLLDKLALPDAQISTEMPTHPPLPFVLVSRVTAIDDKVTEDATVSVHCFHQSRDSANDLARLVHSHMLSLTPKTPVAVSTGSVAVDQVVTVEGPAWQDYGDADLQRYVARYEVTSRFNSQPLS